MPISPKIADAISDGRVRLAPGPESHMGLARAILKAWQDEGYKQRLLSFPADAPQILDRDYKSTKQALREAFEDVGVDPDANDLPNLVVLTPYQFAQANESGWPYKGIRRTDVVLVLPEPIGLRTEQDVRTAMLVSVAGI